MTAINAFQVRYRFERIPGVILSEFEQFGQAAQRLVRTTPWLVPHLPFATTAKVSGGLLEAMPTTSEGVLTAPGRDLQLRLKAIETSGRTLLEHSYDKAGRLLATVYPDGVRIRYDWSAASQLSRVHCGTDSSISFDYGKRGLLDSVAYSSGARFRYEYGTGQRLVMCEYPDQRIVRRNYDRYGRLVKADLGLSGFSYEWDKHGMLTDVTIRCGGETRKWTTDTSQISAPVTPTISEGTFGRRVASAFGFLDYAVDGRLCEMVRPDGERLCIQSGESRASEYFWNAEGQTRFDYDENGVVAAMLLPTGLRTVFHRIPDSRNVWMVDAGGVTLYEYDKRGRLSKIRSDNGQYVVLTHDRRGLVKTITTALGSLRLHHDGDQRLDRLTYPNGLSATVTYGTTGRPNRVELCKIKPDALTAILMFANILWQWTATKPVLRLKDQILRET